MKVILTLILAAVCTLASTAYADPDQCAQACPSGETMVSYLGGGDGNSPVDCQCVADDGQAMPNDDADYGDPDTSAHEYTGE